MTLRNFSAMALVLTTLTFSVTGCGKKAEEAGTTPKAAEGKSDSAQAAKPEQPAGEAAAPKADAPKADAPKADAPSGEAPAAPKAATGGQSAIVGKWAIDIEALKESDEVKKLPEEEREASIKMMEGLLGSMTIEFTSDKIIMEMMGKQEESAYTVKSTSDDKLVIEAKSKREGSEEEKVETINIVITGDRLEMENGGQKFTLKRK